MSNETKIKKWSEIEGDYNDGIIIGNGASIAVFQMFSPENLSKIAKQTDMIPDEIKQIYDYFKTNDFEFILRILWQTYLVNDALKIPQDNKTYTAYTYVREALLNTIQKIHLKQSEIAEGTLSSIAKFLRRFKTVASLNYDLIIYWAMIYEIYRTNTPPYPFIDGWIDRQFKPSSMEGIKNQYQSTSVIYPHGNLAFAQNRYKCEIKIKTTNYNDLLTNISEAWNSNNLMPIFVSEGTSEHKLEAIRKSKYLYTVYNDFLPKLGETIVIYGWSMSEQDSHILDAIAKGGVKKIAISIYQPQIDSQKKIHEFREKIYEYFDPSVHIDFFDSESCGCWIH